MSINPKQCKHLKLFERRKTKLVQKVEIECKNLKLNWLTGKSRKKKTHRWPIKYFVFKSSARPGWRNSWRNFSLIAWCACFSSAINQHGEIFSCILLTGNQMIFLAQFGINKHSEIFSKTTNCTRPTGSCNFVSLWKKLLVLIYSKLHSFDYLYKFIGCYLPFVIHRLKFITETAIMFVFASVSSSFRSLIDSPCNMSYLQTFRSWCNSFLWRKS